MQQISFGRINDMFKISVHLHVHPVITTNCCQQNGLTMRSSVNGNDSEIHIRLVETGITKW